MSPQMITCDRTDDTWHRGMSFLLSILNFRDNESIFLHILLSIENKSFCKTREKRIFDSLSYH